MKIFKHLHFIRQYFLLLLENVERVFERAFPLQLILAVIL